MCIIKGLVLLVLGFSVSCGWQRKLQFPVEGGTIEVDQPFPINMSGIRLSFTQGNRSTILHEQKADIILGFVEAVKLTNQPIIGTFTCDMPRQTLAFDLSDKLQIPSERVESKLAEAIRNEYKLSSAYAGDESVFDWACSQEGKRDFEKHHPGGASW